MHAFILSAHTAKTKSNNTKILQTPLGQQPPSSSSLLPGKTLQAVPFKAAVSSPAAPALA